ncbi:MAG: D-galactarate dehydratase [Planctomycetes bacterium]|nr:D-galactarate dehydratase [Planctomycetota bacterium]
MSFLGYPRPDGSVGIRNEVLVLPGGLPSTRICEFVAGTCTMITADSGSGRTARDRETIARMMVGLGRNPNVAAVIVHDLEPGAGYPELNADHMAAQIARSGKPVVVLKGRDFRDALDLISQGIRIAREMVRDASRVRRVEVDDCHLCVGVKCGKSDTTSGIAGNPVVGYLYDHIVRAGGTALFGETTEIIGAEHLLAERAATPEVGRQIVVAALAIEQRAQACGEDIRSINPVPANIAGGITTLEEKSLGAIAKSGTAPIQGVLSYAEGPPGRGLYFVDNWMTGTSIFTGYAAAGTTLNLFQLGGGGALDDTMLAPGLGVVAPVLWTTANRFTADAAVGSIDFSAASVIAGEETIEEAGLRLVQLVREIASGMYTRTETIRYQAPSQAYLQDSPF